MATNSFSEIPMGLVLHPTMQEFSNFAEYWEKVEKEKKYKDYGMIKIVPPAKWKPRAVPISEVMNDIMVNTPIEQNVYGKGGIYELLLIQKKSMSVKDYRKKVESFDAITDNKSLEDVENLFWKNICFSPPLYGADMRGSLFDEGVKWNLKELNGVLKDGLPKPIPGVNDPYLYVGSWKTMFGWHKEDLDLYSINYNHYGKPKFWYCLPMSESPKLEKFARQHFPEYFSKCKEFLRHKTLMISPALLKQHIPDLKIHKMVHYPGEFMITLGGAYHAGFNWGFNIAEAVNFATTRWLDLFPDTQNCKCIGDSVKIDPESLYTNLAKSELFSDHPNVKKYLAETKDRTGHNEEPTVKTQISNSERMEVEKPIREKKSSVQTHSNSSTRSSGVKITPESMEEEKESGNESIRTRASSRLLKKGANPKTRSPNFFSNMNSKYLNHEAGRLLANDESKNITLKETQPAEKVSKSKKIKKEAEQVKSQQSKSLKTSMATKQKSKTKIPQADNPQALKKALKNSKCEDVLVENWVQCDSCSKWRKITKKNVWNKIKNIKSLKCKDIPGFDCQTQEEYWKKDYLTISMKQKAGVSF